MGLLTKINTPVTLMGVAWIAGVPLAWTIVARNEYRRHTLEKAFRSKKAGAYFLAFMIFAGALVRDYVVIRAIREQPDAQIVSPRSECALVRWAGGSAAVVRGFRAVGGALMVAGTTFVVSSFLRLGVLGCYLGDYFGILMEEKITGFPFNVLENPMYTGAMMNWAGLSLRENSSIGLAYTFVAWLVYHVVSAYENPFTEQIYADHHSAQEKDTKK